MKAAIVDGPPNLAQAVTEWQALSAECVALADKLQGMRGQCGHLEALLLATIPNHAAGARAGGVVISEHRGRLFVEPDLPETPYRIAERALALVRTERRTERQTVEMVNAAQRGAA